ncbi:DUF3296 domain-containing protein [Citrobacter sp. S2-9]|uniref:DUF3296 domain-containing protein n=1 Tax=Citrobacter enshiensis TaxID=2971264 RepID=A0ABT8PVN0_9ENTR|nr:DUF3296 domain-containing protein [Citrobacter enshiensis]MDN8599751.1 DUF3296 domain-containing protein [Citrobacter enshiensis]
MNHSYIKATGADSADVVSTRTFLQQAVDHYPRLAVFSFMLELPYRETMNEYRSLVSRFHTEVWQRIGEYSGKCQQARRHSPPTVLRWMWETVSEPECRGIMLMNFDTLGTVRNPPLIENTLQEMSALIDDAWRKVTEAESRAITMSSFIISRSDRCSFTQPFSHLLTRVNDMASLVMTARTGVICP